MTTNKEPLARQAILFDDDRVGCLLAISEILQFVTAFRDSDSTSPDRTITIGTTSVQLKWNRHEGKISYWNLVDPVPNLPRLNKVPPEMNICKPVFFLGLVKPGPYIISLDPSSQNRSFPAGTPLCICTGEMWGIIDNEGCRCSL